ncbi:conserved hypothetical protein [Trichinella spiralis]|uniref:hypothetical protein n=1 Tax=Trichinella spiralis TaxID=6334 RepID=UPI0001EFE9CE|nr:conserved hypothetical protein [Trichinella spiralis]
MNNECKEKLKKLPQTFCACAKEKSPEIVQQLRRTYKKCYDADAAEEQVKKIIMRKTKSECDEYKRIWNFCKSERFQTTKTDLLMLHYANIMHDRNPSSLSSATVQLFV